ncbi:hypothetical protein G4B88_017051 [Cannabis sativa]|uniref:NADH-ubiquinone oxidoreductase chain 3 n=1 Tax=Cannabis sativa TaxID=3483 RepID=A0A7J6GZC4_CANSA|nr:hypothetical protein G4B88_017051 [Cannabis sativa]
MFALVFVVFDVETIFLYPWAMSFDVLGVSVFIEALIFVLILIVGSRFDFDRYGLVPRSSPRQADLILTAGTVTMKMAPSLVRLYAQMPEPKYENRCFTTSHKFRVKRGTHTRSYNQGLLYQPPSTVEIPTERFFKYKSSVSFDELVN